MNGNRLWGQLGDNPPPPGPSDLTLGKLEVTKLPDNNLLLSLSYSGDSNNNSQVSVHFCSIKAQAGCEPIGSEVVTLSKHAGVFEGTVNLNTTSITPGDFLKYQIVATDGDGVTSSKSAGFSFVPPGTTQGIGLLQLNDFGLGRGEFDLSFAGSDNIFAATVDASNHIYIAGSTTSSIHEPGGGGEDLLIIKLNSEGQLDNQFGNKGILHLGRISSTHGDRADIINAMALDANGNLFVAGNTHSALGGPNASDIIPLALDANRNIFTTGFSFSAAGPGNTIYDGFIAKLNATTGVFDTTFGDGDGHNDDGILQLNASQTNSATGDDYITALALDANGDLFTAGYTDSALGGPNAGQFDGFIAKLNSTTGAFDSTFGDGDGHNDDGILQLNDSQTNSAVGHDSITTMALDSNGNLFIAGYTSSALGGANAGGYDGFIAKLNATTGALDSTFGDGDGHNDDGILQLNSSQTNSATGYDNINTMLLDSNNNLFVAGHTMSALGGSNAGSRDGFIAKLNATTGALDSTFGDGDGHNDDGILHLNASQTNSATSHDSITNMVIDAGGNLFVAGETLSGLGGPNAGGIDGFIAKLNATTGVFDSTFGDGDGHEDDGILQLNDSQANSAAAYDYITTVMLDTSGSLLFAGYTASALGGVNSGEFDTIISKINSTTGAFDTTFGEGDGHDTDGILQLNTGQTNSAVGDDYITALAIDPNGNLFIAGSTYSALGGTKSGSADAFIAKLNVTTGAFDSTFGDGDGHNGDGILQLNDSLTNSATAEDVIHAMELDANGNLFIAGQTSGALGGVNSGNYDAFIAKLNATTGTLDTTFGGGDGNDDDGILQLNDLLTNSADSYDEINALTLDANGNLFAAGNTNGALGGALAGSFDGFIAKLNATTGALDTIFGDGDGHDDDGILQFNNSQTNSATSWDSIGDLALDANGNVFVAGYTSSALGGVNSGSSDAFIAKLDATTGVFDTTFGDGDGHNDDGILQLNDSLTNSADSYDEINALTLDSNGNLFAAGTTYSALGGVNAGESDGFIAKLNATTGVFDTTFGDGDGNDDDGILQLNDSLTNSAESDDYINTMELDANGNLFIAGNTESALGGVNAGATDAFISKLNATTGVLDTTFGDGDGNDNDGILHLNDSQTNSAYSYDDINAMKLDANGNLFVAGNTNGDLGGPNAGLGDGFILQADQITGEIPSP